MLLQGHALQIPHVGLAFRVMLESLTLNPKDAGDGVTFHMTNMLLQGHALQLSHCHALGLCP